jgi:hypothetical protein
MPALRKLLLRGLTVTSALCFAIVPRIAFAQAAPSTDQTAASTTTTASATTTTEAAPENETVELSPFVVDSSEEKGSYKANSTLAGTRVRTDLADNPSALQVVTAQFLQDTGATSNSDLLVYTTNTEIAGLNGNFSGVAGSSQFSENLLTPSTTTRVRGLSQADNTRDYFITDIPWDSFNVGRVDISRGPNSILFGNGSPGGIINNDINDAEFTNATNFTNRVGSFGSFRDSVDYNYVLIPNTLAIRLAWVNDEAQFQQRYAFNDMTRYYGALRYDPKLFGKDSHTSIRAKFEQGHTTSDNPRALPPDDEISAWFQDGKPLINAWKPGQFAGGTLIGNNPTLDMVPSNGGVGSPVLGGSIGNHEGRTYWQDVVTYFNGTENNGTNSSEPSAIFAGGISTALSPNHAIGDLPSTYYMAVAPWNTIYQSQGIPGASYYSDKLMMDPSVFNFYDNLLDGPNKKEWQDWTAINASISQTFFDDRIGFELVYDNQHYVNGQVGFMGGNNYAISVDVNATYIDGSANPNAGRPYVASSAQSYQQQANVIDRNSWRGTVTADVRSSDFFSKDSFLAKVLGDHHLTGLLEEDNRKSFYESWAEYATDVNWETSNGYGAADSINNYRQFDWVDYIGPNLLGQSSAAGANLGPISTIIAPSSQSIVRNFNSTWNAPNVSPTAPYTYTAYSTGTTVTGTQADNPANYVGWQETTVNWLSANNPQQFPDLVAGATRSSTEVISQGFTWQGNMLFGTFVPTFGWRKDTVIGYNTQAPLNSNTAFETTDFGENPDSRLESIGESKAWGGVFHIPKRLTSWLPWGTTLSLFYDHDANFQAGAPRISLLGQSIPNPTGKTKEYGFMISTLNDKLTFKADWYNTTVAGATLDGSNTGGLGGGGYQIWAVPAWGYQYATALQQGFEGTSAAVVANYGAWNYGYVDQGSYTGGSQNGHSGNTPTTENPNDPDSALTQQIINAWLNFPLGVSFFNAWGVHPNPINPALAKASGQLVDAYEGTPFNAGAGWYSLEQPGPLNPVTTVDTLSKGQEFELSAQPTRNWNITINYARTFATHDTIDSLTAGFMSQLTQFFAGPGGQLRIWGAYGSPIQQNWVANVYDPYLVEVDSQGQSAPEVSPWRFNLITTYGFEHGKLKGYFVGGAARLEAGRIEGYAYSPTLGTLNVAAPMYGPNDEHYDLWVGYSKKIFANKINWRIQLNLKNVAEKTRLVAAQYEPDGSLALARIQEGMTWNLTNSFDF